MTRDEALTHDEIYERLYSAWLQLPGCDGKTSIGGLIADLESEPEPPPCACGGRIPIAVVKVTLRKHPEQHTHFAILPIYYQPESDGPFDVTAIILEKPCS